MKIEKEAWVKEFAEILVKATGIEPVYALQCAEVSHGDCGEDMTPQEAVEEELAHWTE